MAKKSKASKKPVDVHADSSGAQNELDDYIQNGESEEGLFPEIVEEEEEEHGPAENRT